MLSVQDPVTTAVLNGIVCGTGSDHHGTQLDCLCGTRSPRYSPGRDALTTRLNGMVRDPATAVLNDVV